MAFTTLLDALPWLLSWWRIRLQCRRHQFNSWVGKICWRRGRLPTPVFLGYPGDSAGKESAGNAGDLGLIPGLGRSPGEWKGYPFQYSGLGKSMDWIVHGSQRVGHDWVTLTLTLDVFNIILPQYKLNKVSFSLRCREMPVQDSCQFSECLNSNK